MTTNTIILLIITAYILISFIIGVVCSSKSKTVQTFLIAKEQLPLWIAIPFLFSCSFAGSYTAGNIGDAYNVGIYSAYPICCMIFGYLGAILLIKMYRGFANKGKVSVPEIFAARFDEKSRKVVLILNTILYAAFFAVQPIAVATLIAPLIGISTTTMAWIITAIFILMAVTGLTGMAWMNIIHAVVMVFGLGITSIVAANSLGGVTTVINSVDPVYFDLGSMGWMALIGFGMSQSFAWFSDFSVSATIIGSRTAGIARKTLLIIALLTIPFTLMANFIGICAKAAIPNLEVASTALYAMAAHLGPFFVVISSIAIIAAVFSSAPPFLLFCSTGITRDFYLPLKPDATNEQQIRISRISMLVIAVVGNFICVGASSFLNILFSIAQIQCITGLVIMIAYFWKKVDGNAAFWSMVVGGSLSMVWYLLGSPFGIMPVWINIIPGIIVLVVLTLLAKKPVADGYQAMQEAINSLNQ